MTQKHTITLGALAVVIGFLAGGIIWWQNNQTETKSQADLADEVNQDLQSLSDAQTGTINFNLKVDSLPVEDNTPFITDVSGQLSFETSDIENPSSILTINGALETADGDITFQDLSLLSKAQKLYLKLQDLSGDAAANTDWGLDLSQISGQWYLVDSQKNDLSLLPLLPYLASSQSQQLDGIIDIATLKSALKDASIFKDVAKLADDNLDGVDTEHYSFAGLDVNKTATLLSALSSVDNSSSDIAELEKQLEELNLSGDIWIGTNDDQIKKISFDVSEKNENQDSLNLMNLEVNLAEVNQPVSIEEPTNAKNLTSAQFGSLPLLQISTPNAGEQLNDLTETDQLDELDQ